MTDTESDLPDLEVSELVEDEPPKQISEYDIVSAPNDFNTLTINSFIEEGAIKIPRFQRNYVWDRKRASKLIESLILGLPVPQVFLYEEDKNNFLVIDGQQRLLTVFFFSKGRFPRKEKRSILRDFFNTDGGISTSLLTDDEYFEDFKLSLPSLAGTTKNRFAGLKYGTLGEFKRQFDLRTIRNVIVKQVSPEDDDSAMFEMFNRLNTGGVNLNPQEIRASLYHSRFFESVFKLNQNGQWRKMLGSEDPDSRMKDIELVLRSLALRRGTEGYSGSMTAFVNRFCKAAKKFSDGDINQIAADWDRFMTLARDCNAETFKVSSSRFSPLLFEAIYGATLSLMDAGVKVDRIDPSWVKKIGRDDKFTQWAQEGSTKTLNVTSRQSTTRELLAELVGSMA